MSHAKFGSKGRALFACTCVKKKPPLREINLSWGMGTSIGDDDRYGDVYLGFQLPTLKRQRFRVIAKIPRYKCYSQLSLRQTLLEHTYQ